MSSTRLVACLLLTLLVSGALGGASADVEETLTLPTVPSAAMQADGDHPIWELLRAVGHTQAEWAQLMLNDLDGNGRTDFLDVVMEVGAATGLGATHVELLVYADDNARGTLLAIPDAVDIEGLDAVFLTVRLDEVASLHIEGVHLVVWEPRAYTAAISTNPAGGSPQNMPQNMLHQASASWATHTGDGVRIAVIDTGANPSHTSLSGKIADFKDCTSSATTAYDDHGHGTHVASTAAGDGGTAFKGLAYEADLTIIKILDLNGSGTLAWFTCGVTHVRSGGPGGAPTADVATMSAGLGVPPLGITTLNGGELDLFGWDTIAEFIPNADIPFTVAAGNWIGTLVEVIGLDETTHVGVNGVNQVSSPAFANKVIAVGAVDQHQAAATFTGLGPGKLGVTKPDVAAMGVNTWGAINGGSNNRYENWAGTSMATPIAAAAIALMIEKDPTLPQAWYRHYLRTGATNGCVLSSSMTSCTIDEPTSPNWVNGYGVVRAKASLDLV